MNWGLRYRSFMTLYGANSATGILSSSPGCMMREDGRGNGLVYLTDVLSNTLKLLHPFMPFITEEIWQHLPHEGESIMISPWPELDQDEVDLEAEEQMEAYNECH